MTTPATPATPPDFRPTHVVPHEGLPAWEEPDVSRPTEPLDPLLPVQLIGRRGDWGQILCANGWSAWVDGRLLVSVPQNPPAPGLPIARTADPRPLLARVEESLSQYRRAAEDLTAGRTDGEGFRRRTQGLRVGMVVDGESVWLYDAEHERWVYCDGKHLTTYATSTPPAESEPPPRDPTEVTDRPPADMPGGPPAGPDATQVVGPARGNAPATDRATPPDPAQLATQAPGDNHTAPPEPTQVVNPPTTAPGGPSPNGRAAEPTRIVDPPTADPTERSHNGRATPPEPTQVVDPQAADPPTRRSPDGAAPPEQPTRVVDPAAADTGVAGRPSRNGRAAAPPPTRIVGTGAAQPDDGDDGDDGEVTRIVGPGDGSAPVPHPPPTRPGDG